MIKLTRLILVLSIWATLGLPSSFGQQPDNWSSITPEDNIVFNGRNNLYYSSNLDLTIPTGHITDSTEVSYIPAYNGNTWIRLCDSVAGMKAVIDYEEGILIGSPEFMSDSIDFNIAYFDGVNYTFPWNFNGSIHKFKRIGADSTLYALGNFTSINDNEVYKCAKLVNGEWVEVVNDESISFASFYDIEIYDNELFIGGNFENENCSDLAKIIEGELFQVGDGLQGSSTSITELQIYDNKLYMAGCIPLAAGNPGNHILLWDGTSLQNVGEPLIGIFNTIENNCSGQVTKLDVQLNKLYVGGSFYFIGDEVTYGIAKWDGQSWCGVYTNQFNLYFQTFGFYSDSLIAVIPYVYSYSPLNYEDIWIYEGGAQVSHCIESLYSMNNEISREELLTFPNPTEKMVFIESPYKMHSITLLDLQGKSILNEDIKYTTTWKLDVSQLKCGLYLLKVRTSKGNLFSRIIKRK